ncbi:hypothetical protein [Carboxylicivirga sp. RSCT41]|uniref:hypothetical protein n=1 Tax=Carboxylicivirga agarovorans TaxID=3417570 RepID=UPI003D35408A
MYDIKNCKTIKNYSENLESSLIVDSIFNHFDGLDGLNFISAEFSIPPLNPSPYYIRSLKAECIVICSSVDSVFKAPKFFIYETTPCNEENFILSMIFKEKLVFNKDHDIYYKGNYPIPDLGRYDFNAGFTKTDTIIGGERFVYKRYNVPSDTKIYVHEAKNGSFWKVDADVYRPETMDEWKHGYSKGTAISKERNIILYWFIVW